SSAPAPMRSSEPRCSLRDQLRVLERRVGKPAWHPGDRLLLAGDRVGCETHPAVHPARGPALKRSGTQRWFSRTSVPSATSTESKAATTLRGDGRSGSAAKSRAPSFPVGDL